MPALHFPNSRLDQAVASSRGMAQPSMGAFVVQCASVLRRSGVGQPTSWRWQQGAKHGNVLIRGYRPRRPVSRAAWRKGELQKLAAHGEGQAMPIEVIIIWLVVGAIAGWLAGVIVSGGGFGLIGDIIIGIIGAVVGGWLLPRLGIFIGGGFIGAIINALIGAVIVLLVVRLVKR
jgi:uncharacterized membrane protein YeaQ/YmgE (transglycosylase-associated protein family)